MSATPSSSAAPLESENGGRAERMASVLARAFALWRKRDYARRREAIAAIARSAGYSVAMIEESFDALLKPFTSGELTSMASRISASGADLERRKTVGFIMAGNVAGAGIHEVAIALMTGARVIIKTASAEPVFYREFARTIAEIDREAGSRVEILNWSRARADLTAALIAKCDCVVAYGDDATIESLRRHNAIEFGSRVSVALVTDPSGIAGAADLLARDVALFEQLGCLSLHQVFVVSPDTGAAREVARRMAAALERINKSMPPAPLPLRDAAAIRGVRERARWRAIAGDQIELFEGRDLEWTVVFEPEADSFNISPGFRTVHVSGVRDLDQFRACVASVAGRIEAMAVVGDDAAREARSMRIPYVCAAGEMQSPPLDWRHGGGRFLDLMVGSR